MTIQHLYEIRGINALYSFAIATTERKFRNADDDIRACMKRGDSPDMQLYLTKQADLSKSMTFSALQERRVPQRLGLQSSRTLYKICGRVCRFKHSIVQKVAKATVRRAYESHGINVYELPCQSSGWSVKKRQAYRQSMQQKRRVASRFGLVEGS